MIFNIGETKKFYRWFIYEFFSKGIRNKSPFHTKIIVFTIFLFGLPVLWALAFNWGRILDLTGSMAEPEKETII